MEENATHDLEVRNRALGYLLLNVRLSVTVYRVIGLNWSHISTGNKFFGFVQNQQVESIALGFSKVFERESNRYHLNSILSMLQLIREKEIVPRRIDAIQDYFTKWKIGETSCWGCGLEKCLKKQFDEYKHHIAKIRKLRNRLIAHSQAGVHDRVLGDLEVFDGLSNVAFGFYELVGKAFLNDNAFSVESWSVRKNPEVQNHLVNILRELGLKDVATDFPKNDLQK